MAVRYFCVFLKKPSKTKPHSCILFVPCALLDCDLLLPLFAARAHFLAMAAAASAHLQIAQQNSSKTSGLSSVFLGADRSSTSLHRAPEALSRGRICATRLHFTLSPITAIVSTKSPPPSPSATSSSTEVLALPTVLVAEKLGEGGLELLRKVANVDCSYNLTPEDLCAKISLCDALIVRSGTKVTREVFEASKGRLKVVGRAGVGIDNVDLQAATEFGCLVVNAPTANTVAAAEHGIALLAAMARNISQASASLKAGKALKLYLHFQLVTSMKFLVLQQRFVSTTS